MQVTTNLRKTLIIYVYLQMYQIYGINMNYVSDQASVIPVHEILQPFLEFNQLTATQSLQHLQEPHVPLSIF